MDILQINAIVEFMIGLKNIIDFLDITILNIELYTVGEEWNYQKISNPYSRIYYITEGYGVIRHHEREFELVPGSIYLVPCYTTVNLFCPEHFTHFYVHFTSRLQTGLDILSLFQCSYQVDESDNSIGKHLFERLLQLNPGKELVDYDANKPIYTQVFDRAAHLDKGKSPGNLLESNAIIRMLLSAFLSDHSFLQVQNTLHGLKRFDKVFEYIQDHLEEPITIPELAKLANLNPTYFSNLFRKLMGIPPLQFINKRRIEKAQELLLGTDETLYGIAHQVGFCDEFYFSRLFKKTVGIAPDHYRKQQIYEQY